MTRWMKVFLMAANIAFGISTSLKKTASTANANRQQRIEDVCGALWVREAGFWTLRQRLVLAPCNLYRLLVNFGDTWIKQKGHILNPSTSTEAGHVIKKAAHTLCFCTLFQLGKNRSWSVENKTCSLKAVAVSEWRRGQERRQQRSQVATRENPRDERCMETSEHQRMPRNPGGTAQINIIFYPTFPTQQGSTCWEGK